MPRLPMPMEITTVGAVYQLSRDQWCGNIAKITKDDALLEEVKKYTWTYTTGDHPYLRCTKIGLSLHEFVLGFIYGAENIDKMQAEGNIIEHLDNDGLNCTYENLHILSEDMNKTKAFSIDKIQAEDGQVSFPPYILDVYYLHDKKQFQMQICMNDDIYFNTKTGTPVEMFICGYDDFDNLYLDWFYLLKCRVNKKFDIVKFNAIQIYAKERPMITVTPEEMNSPCIVRDGVVYLNLDAKHNGVPMSCINHTALRKIEINGE